METGQAFELQSSETLLERAPLFCKIIKKASDAVALLILRIILDITSFI